MVRSIELLGLMTFQSILAVIIAVGLMASSKEEIIGKLTPSNIERFVNEMSTVVNGTKPEIGVFKGDQRRHIGWRRRL